jgi:aminoglycoside phosphotransferase
MTYDHGFFHGDPHAWNFFVLEDETIGMIDYGMVGRLDEHPDCCAGNRAWIVADRLSSAGLGEIRRLAFWSALHSSHIYWFGIIVGNLAVGADEVRMVE